MAANKKFSAAEKSAFLGLAELFRAGFINANFFKFDLEEVGPPEQYQEDVPSGEVWFGFTRQITFRRDSTNSYVRIWVTTGPHTKMDFERYSESLDWSPDRAVVRVHTQAPCKLKRSFEPVPHWYSLGYVSDVEVAG